MFRTLYSLNVGKKRREYLIKKAKVCLIEPNLIRKKILAAYIKWYHCNTLRFVLLFIKTRDLTFVWM